MKLGKFCLYNLLIFASKTYLINKVIFNKYRNISQNKNCFETKDYVTQQAKEDDFVVSHNLLFNIAHHNAVMLSKVEEVFLTEKCSESKYVTL